jgi:hypothetical protein
MLKGVIYCRYKFNEPVPKGLHQVIAVSIFAGIILVVSQVDNTFISNELCKSKHILIYS